MNVCFLVGSQFFFCYIVYNVAFNDFISIAFCYIENSWNSQLRMSQSSAHSNSGTAQLWFWDVTPGVQHVRQRLREQHVAKGCAFTLQWVISVSDRLGLDILLCMMLHEVL